MYSMLQFRWLHTDHPSRTGRQLRSIFGGCYLREITLNIVELEKLLTKEKQCHAIIPFFVSDPEDFLDQTQSLNGSPEAFLVTNLSQLTHGRRGLTCDTSRVVVAIEEGVIVLNRGFFSGKITVRSSAL